MWSGAKKNGNAAGGGVLETTCPRCQASLFAFEDVYDENGDLPDYPKDWSPELTWSLKSQIDL
jgi:hypothetical protein